MIDCSSKCSSTEAGQWVHGHQRRVCSSRATPVPVGSWPGRVARGPALRRPELPIERSSVITRHFQAGEDLEGLHVIAVVDVDDVGALVGADRVHQRVTLVAVGVVGVDGVVVAWARQVVVISIGSVSAFLKLITSSPDPL